MEPNNKLETIKEYARTVVLEPQTKSKIEDSSKIKEVAREILNLFSKNVLQNTEIESKKQEPPIIQQKVEKPVVQKNTETIIQKPTIKNVEVEDKKEQEISMDKEKVDKNDENIENQVESLYNSSLSIQSTTDENIKKELNTYDNSKPKGYQFRIRLLTGVFCCIFAILGGWIIGNAVDIASTSSQISSEIAKGEEYKVNIVEYLAKISKLDSANESSPPPSGEGALIPIDEIIPITPQPLEDTTAYTEESNWFDKICNWFKNLFGG